jgi:hypothetical protein
VDRTLERDRRVLLLIRVVGQTTHTLPGVLGRVQAIDLGGTESTPRPERRLIMPFMDSVITSMVPAAADGLYLRLGLAIHKRTFGGSVRSLSPRCRRSSRTRFSCSPIFIARGTSWRGTAQIWLSFHGKEVWWFYSLRLRGYPRGCHRASCSRSVVVH